MSTLAIKVENLSKRYELGTIGTGSLARDVQGWMAKLRGKEDPNSIINQRITNNEQRPTEHWALKDVSFEIQQGEAVGIIGKNGAGKSTLLKILSRVTAPTVGTIKVKGRIASLLEVGTGFHGDLSGRENIFMNGAILGMSKAEIKTKLDEIIDFSGVEHYIDTPVKRYSSGMYVRLAFAVAAHLEPDILVVDEVLAVGDAEFQKKCLGKMDDVSKKEGRTVIFVSHNMTSILNLCNTAIFLENGNIISKNTTNTIIDLYLSKKQLLNQTNINARKDRIGNGYLKFESVQFRNLNQEQIDVAYSGMDFKICIQLINKQKIELSRLQVDLGIKNNLGQEVSWLSTSLSNWPDSVKFIEEALQIEFNISKLPLLPGNYFLAIFCKYDGEVADWIEDVCDLKIVYGDFYTNGKTNKAYGNTMIFHTTSINFPNTLRV